MTKPSLYFIDKAGQKLPASEDGVQHIKQYEQFWYVKVNGYNNGRVYLESDSWFSLELVNGKTNTWQIPPRLSFEDKKRISGSGEITAILCNQDNVEICRNTLLVFPANITEAELKRMIADIGQLAISTTSCLYYAIELENIGNTLQKTAKHENHSNGLVETALSLLDLYEVVKQNWSLLEKRPLKSITQKAVPTSIHKARKSPKSLITAKLKPHNNKVLDIGRIETTDCIENQFICYILDVYLKNMAEYLSKALETQVLSLDNIETSILKVNKLKNYNSVKDREIFSNKNIEKFYNSRRTEKEKIQKIINELKLCKDWVNQYRNSRFIKNIITPNQLPSASNRLLGSPGYSLIFSKFYRYINHNFKPLQQNQSLIKSIAKHQIRTTWEIYEIWCFIKLYSSFILYAGLRPKQQSLFESLKITNEGLIISRNKEFSLIKKWKGSDFLEINFWYDTFYKGKRPDIRLEVKIDGHIKQYCFDAKYRNYSRQGYNTLVNDIKEVAINKYLRHLNLTASFIFHSSNKKDDYWGEVPFSSFLRDYNQEMSSTVTFKDSRESERGHKYGGITLLPNQDSDISIRKVIRLLLQYHEKNQFLETLCLNCGHWGNPGISSTSTVGKYYFCEQCGDFWVISHCQGKNHRLVKFKDSFHKKTDPNSAKWSYTCPVCDSKF